MRVMINFSILTLGTDGNRINNIINTNSQLLQFQKTIVDYNNQYALSTYDKNTIFEIAKDVGDLANISMQSVKLKDFTFFYEDSICFKVQGSNIYQLNNLSANISKNASKSNSGISPELVTKLLTSITQILQNIANNTAPVGKIYQALLAYVQAGGDSGIKNDTQTPIKVDKTKNNQTPEPEIDSSIATLVGVLAELAKG